MDAINRKISKAVFLLLEKYHRLYGLEAYFFSGGHGPGYVGFQVAANRCWDERQNNANYDLAGAENGSYGPLVAYLCGHVAVPFWAAGRQLEMAGGEHQRTSAIVAWLEQHLALRALFERNADAIARWRASYSVEQSEQYLLMVNLAGLLATAANDFPRTPSQCVSDYDPEQGAKVARQLDRLDLTSERGTVMGTHGIMVARNGKGLVGDKVVNLWQRYLAGESTAELVGGLLALRQAQEQAKG